MNRIWLILSCFICFLFILNQVFREDCFRCWFVSVFAYFLSCFHYKLSNDISGRNRIKDFGLHPLLTTKGKYLPKELTRMKIQIVCFKPQTQHRVMLSYVITWQGYSLTPLPSPMDRDIFKSVMKPPRESVS